MIKMQQTCEMCGVERDLPVTSSHPKTPNPDSGGWRLLNAGSKEATLCHTCVAIVVEHAQKRAAVREEGHAGLLNEQPLVLTFYENRS